MPVLSRRWNIAPPVPAVALFELQDYSPVLRQILYQRGYRTRQEAQDFLEARPPGDNDPYKMKGIPEAVDRIALAITNRELIAVYGDYDADGVTATALLTLALEELGVDVRPYIPNRFDDGYGLSNEGLSELKAEGVGLVISVDCGIRSIDEAQHAREIGLDLIISDHHHPGSAMPQALAVINPKQPGDEYPEKNLAGVGLAYKLAQALFDPEGLPVESYLDLVALGTISDLAPLVGENRTLVRRGLDYLRRPTRQGVMSLIGAAGLAPSNLNTSHVGFALGPRLNAAGRIDSANAALELLTTHDLNQAGVLAQQLDNQNRDRQRRTLETQLKAEEMALRDNPDAFILFAADPEFNHGIVGLAASRLTEKHYRPAIVAKIDLEKNETRGSCRSIPEFHITEALDQCADLLVKHGGHAAAAGFTVHNEHLFDLISRLQKLAEQQLGGLDLRPTLSADMEMPLYDLKPAILKDLKQLEPTGQENRRAVFVSRGLKVTRKNQVGNDGAHLKLEVTDGWITYSAIAFQQGYWYDQMPEQIDLMYYYEANEYNGRSSLQLNVIDLKPTGAPDY